MLSKRPEQSLQELAASGSWKHSLGHSPVTEGLCIHGTGSPLRKAVTSQAKVGVFNLVTSVLFQEPHGTLIIY